MWMCNYPETEAFYMDEPFLTRLHVFTSCCGLAMRGMPWAALPTTAAVFGLKCPSENSSLAESVKNLDFQAARACAAVVVRHPSTCMLCIAVHHTRHVWNGICQGPGLAWRVARHCLCVAGCAPSGSCTAALQSQGSCASVCLCAR